MSKNVKLYMSEHFGAPELKGDRWGYTVELLRKCLCYGFNERTDIVSIETVSNKQIKITFETEHKYVPMQTIKLSAVLPEELNDEFRIDSVDALTVTATGYKTLVFSGVSTTSGNSIVAPLGFTEAFTDGANISAFTDDTQDCYFVIDDTQPDSPAWSVGQMIRPLCYMTDKMSDINTPGETIVPYDPANPLFYKTRGYKAGYNNTGTQYYRNGLCSFMSNSNYGVTAYNNTDTLRQMTSKWTLIGNGRMFYFIPAITNTYATNFTNISIMHVFGRFNNITKDNYMLLMPKTYAGYDYFSYNNWISANIAFRAYINSNSNYTPNTTFNNGLPRFILKNKYLISTVNFLYINNSRSYNATGHAIIDATQNNIKFPDTVDKKLYLDNLYAYYDVLLGKISGVFITPQIKEWQIKDRLIKQVNKNNKKYNYYICNTFTDAGGGVGGTGNPTIYLISLENEDWYNYD